MTDAQRTRNRSLFWLRAEPAVLHAVSARPPPRLRTLFHPPFPKPIVKVGSTIPLKFQLLNAAGQPISDTEAQSLVTPSCKIGIVLVIGGPVTGCPTYSSLAHGFQFDLKTTAAMKGSNGASISVTIDGTIVSASAIAPFTVNEPTTDDHQPTRRLER